MYFLPNSNEIAISKIYVSNCVVFTCELSNLKEFTTVEKFVANWKDHNICLRERDRKDRK